MNSYYVYVAFLDGVPRYVGAGHKKRDLHVNSGCSHNVQLNRVVLAENLRFDVRRLEVNLSRDEAYRLECEYIRKYGLAIDGGTLWNETYGGIGYLARHTAKTKERIGEASKERWDELKNDPVKYQQYCDKLKNAENSGRFKKGRVVSREEIDRIRKLHIGRKRSEETRQKMSASQRGISKGKLWVTNNTHSAFITEKEIDNYIARGYRRGRTI